MSRLFQSSLVAVEKVSGVQVPLLRPVRPDTGLEVLTDVELSGVAAVEPWPK